VIVISHFLNKKNDLGQIKTSEQFKLEKTVKFRSD